MEIVVEPEYLASYGDTYYIISDFHNGRSLKDKLDWFDSLSKKLFLFRYLADLMTILEDHRFLFLDVCLDNFLVIRQTAHHYQLRLFDLDSILDLSDIDNMHQADGNIFYHEAYAAGEILDLERSLRKDSFDDIKKDYLEKSAAVYSLGVLFFRILFGRIPAREERLMEKEKWFALTGELADDYGIARDTAQELLGLLRNMLSEQWERYRSGFGSCRKVLEFLNEFSDRMNYEVYMSRMEMANANATFAAYNMLQKFPLFHYAGPADNETPAGSAARCVKAAFVGDHMMRAGFLSAFLSIGQMLNTELEIAVLSPDAERFWDEFAKRNPGLRQAIRLEIGGKQMPDQLNPNLVRSPLARIRILNGEAGQEISGLYREGYRYFVLFDSETKILKTIEALSGDAADADRPRICVGCLLRTGRRLSALQEYEKVMDIHRISGRNVSEVYSEGMYREQIYKMGLMAHVYYAGYLNRGCTAEEMKRIEDNYREDVYSRMSSERAALHAIYKMGSVGIDVSRPGKSRACFEKLKDEQTVEELSWLEHRSWTAYMLSMGHRPVSVSEMDSYAYRWGNDWKDRRGPHGIRHPLLAASDPVRRLPRDGWQDLSEEELERLDPLDRVSVGIYRWYLGRREFIIRELDELFSAMERTADPEILSVLKKLERCAGEYAEHMGERPDGWDPGYSAAWEQALDETEKCLKAEAGGRSTALIQKQLEQLKQRMKIVQDAYRNRDYKQLDRDIVYSMLDMVMV